MYGSHCVILKTLKMIPTAANLAYDIDSERRRYYLYPKHIEHPLASVLGREMGSIIDLNCDRAKDVK